MLYFFLKTGDNEYKKHCIDEISILTKDTKDGGCIHYLSDDDISFVDSKDGIANYVFSTQIISLLAIYEVQTRLGITDFDGTYNCALNSLIKRLDLFDTGSMSSYEIQQEICVDLLYEPTDPINLTINKITCENNIYTHDNPPYQKPESKSRLFKLFNRSDNLHESAIGTSDVYMNANHITTPKGLTNIYIDYSANADTSIVIKKKSNGAYHELGGNSLFSMPAGECQKIITVPTRYLLEDANSNYHSYHIALLTELCDITSNISLKRLLERFRLYQKPRNVARVEPCLQSLSVVLNTECGLHCKMCDIGTQNKDASIYKFLKGNAGTRLDSKLLVQRIKESSEPLGLIHIVGTEPTLYPELPALVKKLKQLGKEVLVTTNGINLKNTLIPLLKSGVDSILISIDGPASVHNYIRGREHLFEDIMKLLVDNKELLLEYKKKNVKIIFCLAITPINYKHISELVNELPTEIITDLWCTHMNYVSQSVADRHNSCHPLYKIWISCIHDEMSPKLVNPWIMLKEMRKAKTLASRIGINIAEAPYVPSLQEYRDLYFDETITVGAPVCTAPFRTMEINADGSACVMSRCYKFNPGNIHDKSIDELFFSAELDDLRMRILSEEQWLPCKRCCAIM